MIRYSILFILLTVGTCLNARSINDYLEKINSNYSELSSFELTLSYKLFKGYDGKEVKDSYQSVLRMNGLNSYRKIYQDEIITTADKTIVLNHDLRTIQVLPPVEQKIFETDIEKSLSECEDIQIRKAKEGERIILTFKEFSSQPYSQIEIVIDENFWVKNMKLYYVNQINFSQDYFSPDMAYPRLEITYENIKKHWSDKEGITELSNYLKKEGEHYLPAKNYKGYEIIQ